MDHVDIAIEAAHAARTAAKIAVEAAIQGQKARIVARRNRCQFSDGRANACEAFADIAMSAAKAARERCRIALAAAYRENDEQQYDWRDADYAYCECFEDVSEAASFVASLR